MYDDERAQEFRIIIGIIVIFLMMLLCSGIMVELLNLPQQR